MSGSYPDTSAETIASDSTAIAAGVAEALTWTAHGQSTTAGFIAESGAAANAGHGQVGVLPPSIAGNG